MRRKSLADLLEAPVSVSRSGCWEWLGTIVGGYGQTTFGGRKEYAHRAAYRLLRGEIPVGLTLDHLCRNRKCINPDHLEPVSGTENCRRGLNTKLNQAEVLEIRRLRAKGATATELGRCFGVSQVHVSRICLGRNWR